MNYHKCVQRYGHRRNESSRNQRSRKYNSFSPLLDYNIECYKCNNYGDKSSNCKLLECTIKTNTSNFLKEKHKKIWKEKQKETKCKVALHAKYKISQWYMTVVVQNIRQEIKKKILT